MSKIQPSTTPAQLLQEARDDFAIGVCIEAEVKASIAIAVMEETYAANNPQLANAYALKAQICREVSKACQGDALKICYLQMSAAALKSEVACRELGCQTEALAKAHFLYGRTLAADLGDSRGYMEIAKAMDILVTMAHRDGVELKTPWLY